MILVIDNYDSFVYNLVQFVGEVTADVDVVRNDATTVEEIRRRDYDGIVVSPGPGTPAEAGICVDLFAEVDIPILGVCLGHQALCAAAGATVGHAPSVVHGKPSTVRHRDDGLFSGLPNPFRAGRYHSLAVDRSALPDSLVETAWTDEERSIVMGVRHRENPHVGLQFHPESILTGRPDDHVDGSPGRLTVGKQIVRNFVCNIT